MPSKPEPQSTAPCAREIVITRTFAAPRELVWRAWSEPELLARWWGPRGFTNPICDWAASPGKKLHVVMRGPNGTDFPMGGTIREVVAPEKLVFTTGALDEQGKMMFEFLHTLELAGDGGVTHLTLRSRLIQTTDGADRYTNGFEAGMTQSLERLAKLATGTAAREIVMSRIFHAPRALVWEAWANPDLIVKWWGPRGFTTTTKQREFRVGGAWELTMHGPDGTNYPNKCVFQEIVPQERIVYRQGGGCEDGEIPGANFTATWTFESIDAERTKVTGCLLFPTAAARDHVVKAFGAVEGGKQTLERLGEQVDSMQSEPFIIAREFDAPRDLVWRAWTEREQFSQWFGPKGCTAEVHKFELCPGGMNHYRLAMPNGGEMWGRAVYREIVPPEKIVWVNSFSDAAGGITTHPMSPTWPKEMLTTVTFAERGASTLVTVHWVPLDATAAERNTFNPARTGMAGGWGGTFDQLTAYLATLTA